MADNYGSVNYGFSTSSSTMDDYDAMPPEVREFYREAPYNYSVANGAALAREHGVEAFMVKAKPALAKSIRMAVIDSYGPDHPQAQ